MQTTPEQDVQQSKSQQRERVSSPSSTAEASAVSLLSLSAAPVVPLPAAGLRRAVAHTPARDGGEARPVMPWADFVPWAHTVLAAYFAAQGQQAAPWDALDAAARTAWRERLGALDRLQVHGSAACARLAYEEVRQHERVVERPSLPWGALTAHAQGPWVFAAALVASWRAGL